MYAKGDRHFVCFIICNRICCDNQTSMRPMTPGGTGNTMGLLVVYQFQRALYGRRSEMVPLLKRIKLKKDSRVYLYNGRLKENQLAQFAVLDVVMSKGPIVQRSFTPAVNI
jgi:hypothetical protein